jgi:Pregnancy-associated plasma protein-A
MKPRLLLFVGLAAILVLVQATSITQGETSQSPIDSDYFCATEHDPANIDAHEKALAKRKLRGPIVRARTEESVNVHFHIITDGDTGNVDDFTIDEQMRVLNRLFELRGLSFNLASVNRISNQTWFHRCDNSGVEKKMKAALRQGTAGDLNIYTCAPEKFLGRSAFPWDYADAPIADGIILHYGVLPGGSVEPFNTGEALVHEVGHWMGLYHTFQGGCDGDGDFVSDTPAEATPSFASCSVGRDTCPAPGLDPTENYMDYSGDSCWTQFTFEQYVRMDEHFAIYRAGQ